MVTLGIIYAWSIFKAPLKELFPTWTNTNLSLNFTIVMCTYAIGTMLGAWLAKVFGRRVTCLMTAALMFLGLFGTSFMRPEDPGFSLIWLYIFFGGFGGLGVGIGYIIMCENTTRWYPDRSGFAMGMVEMGFGFGSLITGGFANYLMGEVGVISCFRILGIIVTILLCIIAIFMKDPSREVLEQYAEEEEEEEPEWLNEKSYTTLEMLKTVEFWSLMIWSSIISASFMMTVDNAALVTAYYGAPAVLGLIVSVSNGGIRIAFGMLVDKFGLHRMSLLHNGIVILCGVLMLIAAYNKSIPLLIIGLIVTGLAFGGTPTSLAIFMRKIYGPKHFSLNYSLTSWGLLISAAMGPTLAGVLQNKATAEGSDNLYLTTMILMLAFCVVGVITGIPFLRRKDV